MALLELWDVGDVLTCQRGVLCSSVLGWGGWD